MTLLDRIHRFARRIGLPPALFDPLVLAIAAAAAGWIVDGTIAATEIRLAAAGVVAGLAIALLDDLHRLAEALGLSPKVFDPLALAGAVALANWIETGAFDAGELRIAAAAVILGLVGYAAPPAVGVTQAELNELARRRRHRIDPLSNSHPSP